MILYNKKPNVPTAAAGGQIPGGSYELAMQKLMSTGIDPYKQRGGTLEDQETSYGRLKPNEGSGAVSDTLNKPGVGYATQGDSIYTRQGTPLDNAYNNINQYNQRLDKALYNKYPNADFDAIKRQAVPLTNDKLKGFVQGGGYPDYNLSPEEQQAALGKDYDTYTGYNSRIKQASNIDTKGQLDIEGAVSPERYGLQNSLFKYNVADKTKPYMFKEDLMAKITGKQ